MIKAYDWNYKVYIKEKPPSNFLKRGHPKNRLSLTGDGLPHPGIK